MQINEEKIFELIEELDTQLYPLINYVRDGNQFWDYSDEVALYLALMQYNEKNNPKHK